MEKKGTVKYTQRLNISFCTEFVGSEYELNEDIAKVPQSRKGFQQQYRDHPLTAKNVMKPVVDTLFLCN